MIEFQDVSRNYGAKVAVKDLSLSIQAGELFSMLGHNGAGKTTTIKMLVGLLRPASGSVMVGGYDVVTQTRDAVQLIGYVPDQPYLYDKLSGREFLRFVAEMHGLSPDAVNDGLEREIDRFGLGGFVDDLTESYSHGMKQRTVFASALLHRPSVLVVDEPMVGLDPQSIRLVKDLFRSETANGLCVLMSTHTLTAAEEVSDRIGVMDQGEMIFQGTVDDLKAMHPQEGATLETLYLRMLNQEERAESPVEPGAAERAAGSILDAPPSH
ncbi:ABC transporter ATP-binding protein [Posidoniimonas polymericola]|nr:ABC transporter ATP-binding protein [Posidoniimonas polymericola]